MPGVAPTAPYRAGFIECTTSIVSFLSRDDSVDAETKIRLLNHLTNYLAHSEDSQRSKLSFQASSTTASKTPWSQPVFTADQQMPRHHTSLWGSRPAPLHTQTTPFFHPHTVASADAVLSRASRPLTNEDLLCHDQGLRIHYSASIPKPPQVHRPRAMKQLPSTAVRRPSSPVVKLEKTRNLTDNSDASRCTLSAMSSFDRKQPVHRQAFMPLENDSNITRQQAVSHSDTLRHAPYHKHSSSTAVNQHLKRVTKRLEFDRSKYRPSVTAIANTENILNNFPLSLEH